MLAVRALRQPQAAGDDLEEQRSEVARILQQELGRQRDLQRLVEELTRDLETASNEMSMLARDIEAHQQQIDDIDRQMHGRTAGETWR